MHKWFQIPVHSCLNSFCCCVAAFVHFFFKTRTEFERSILPTGCPPAGSLSDPAALLMRLGFSSLCVGAYFPLAQILRIISGCQQRLRERVASSACQFTLLPGLMSCNEPATGTFRLPGMIEPLHEMRLRIEPRQNHLAGDWHWCVSPESPTGKQRLQQLAGSQVTKTAQGKAVWCHTLETWTMAQLLCRNPWHGLTDIEF